MPDGKVLLESNMRTVSESEQGAAVRVSAQNVIVEPENGGFMDVRGSESDDAARCLLPLSSAHVIWEHNIHMVYCHVLCSCASHCTRNLKEARVTYNDTVTPDLHHVGQKLSDHTLSPPHTSAAGGAWRSKVHDSMPAYIYPHYNVGHPIPLISHHHNGSRKTRTTRES